MYYIIYLRPTVDRVYFCEDIVVMPPYLNCGKNEIISVYYLFRRSPWIGAKFSIIMTMTRYYNIRLISTSSYQIDKIYSHQNFAPRRCRSDLGHHLEIVFSVADFPIYRHISKLLTLQTQIVSLCTLRDFVYVLTFIQPDEYWRSFSVLPYHSLLNFTCLQYR